MRLFFIWILIVGLFVGVYKIVDAKPKQIPTPYPTTSVYVIDGMKIVFNPSKKIADTAIQFCHPHGGWPSHTIIIWKYTPNNWEVECSDNSVIMDNGMKVWP